MVVNIGIAGSGGKSTTISLLSGILRNAGKRIKVYDNPSLSDVLQHTNTNGALELSPDSVNNDIDYAIFRMSAPLLEDISFDITKESGFDVSVLLNIHQFSPELNQIKQSFRLNETLNKENYYEATLSKIFSGTKQFCIFNASDHLVDTYVQEAEVQEGVRAIGFSTRSPSRSQIGIVEGELVDRAFYEDNTDPLRYLNATPILNVNDFPNIKSPVSTDIPWLLSDVCAAIAVARSLDISPNAIVNAIRQFRRFDNQFQLIFSRNLVNEPEYYFGQIDYINDTYTNDITGAKANFDCLKGNSVIWIGGGDTRFFNYDTLIDDVKGKLLAGIIIGTKNSPIYKSFIAKAPNVPVYLIEPTLDLAWVNQAILKANMLASENNAVFFSPAADTSGLGNYNEIANAVNATFKQLEERYQSYVKIHEFDAK